MVYPEEESEGKITKLWDKAKSVWSGSEADKQLVVPDHNKMQIVCFHAYLANLKTLLVDLALSSDFNIGSAVEHFMQIFKQLHVPLIMKEYPSSRQVWIANDVQKV